MPPDDRDDRLTQTELAALNEALRRRPAPRPEPQSKPAIAHDLLSGAADAGQGLLPRLEVLHESFCTRLANGLSRTTRSEGEVVAGRVRVTRFSEVFTGLKRPVGLIVCQLGELGTAALVTVDPKLLVHLIDVFVGGPGGAEDAIALLNGRGLTATDTRLIGHLVAELDRALKGAWRDIPGVGLSLVRAEVDPRQAAIFEPGAPVVTLPTTVTWGEVSGALTLVVPMSALKSFERVLTQAGQVATAGSDWLPVMADSVGRVELDLVVELGRAELTVRRLLELEVGDTLRLDRAAKGLVPVLVEGLAKLAGSVTVQQGNMAVDVAGWLVAEAAVAEAANVQEPKAPAPAAGEEPPS